MSNDAFKGRDAHKMDTHPHTYSKNTEPVGRPPEFCPVSTGCFGEKRGSKDRFGWYGWYSTGPYHRGER